MKVLVYSKREDEEEFFQNYCKRYPLDLSFTSENLTKENVCLAKGYKAVNIAVAGHIDEGILSTLKQYGVAYIVNRAAGVNHIDLKAARLLELKVSNVPSYSPNAISEHTLMLTLSLMRQLKIVMRRVKDQDFTLKGLRAREIRNMTIGIIGTGKIGFEVVKAFRGLGATVLAYDLYPSEQVKEHAAYVTLEEIYAKSDILSFHCPLTPQNYHLVSESSINQMKEQVCLINTARGELFDYQAVLEALKIGKVGGLGFDVYENEEVFVRYNLMGEVLKDQVFKELTTLENVIFTPHISFYTDEAVSNMVEFSLDNLYEYSTTGKCKNELIR